MARRYPVACVHVLTKNENFFSLINGLVSSDDRRCFTHTEIEHFATRFPKIDAPSCLLVDKHETHDKEPSIYSFLPTDMRRILSVIYRLHRPYSIPNLVKLVRESRMNDLLAEDVTEEELLNKIEEGLAKSRDQLEQDHHNLGILRNYGSLTRRERQILHLVCQGFTTRSIAHRIFLSHKTVEIYRANVMHKMGAKTAAQLVRDTLACHLFDQEVDYQDF